MEVESDVGEMLKIIVFDSGWGGELVADFLMRELTTVEVVRLIDWAHAPYCGKNVEEICELVDAVLGPYVGRVDLIVLGGYAVSLALGFLCEKYPEQKFVGMGINYDMILRSRNFPGQVALLMDRLTSESELRQELRVALPFSTLLIPDCTGWEELINENLMTPEVLRKDLGYDFVLAPVRKKKYERSAKKGESFDEIVARMKKRELGDDAESGDELDAELDSKQQALKVAIAKFSQAAQAAADEERVIDDALVRRSLQIERRNDLRPDVILLLNTHFWEIKLDLEELFGFRVRVLDFREKLLHDVCAALKLRGVHGGRAK